MRAISVWVVPSDDFRMSKEELGSSEHWCSVQVVSDAQLFFSLLTVCRGCGK